tara:strand:+ start:66 stop:1454 length:1389 start_codon:yes stop_codon:yes gene_type:complete
MFIQNWNAKMSQSMQIIESKDDLIKPFEDGEKNHKDFKIGTEHEKFAFFIKNNKPVPFDGKNGIESLLLSLKKFGWESILEDKRTIGLKRSKKIGGGTITLEPAGQVELSGAPLSNLHETFDELSEHKEQVDEIGSQLGIGFLGAGLTPDWSLEEMPVMPKKRYKIMKDYMPRRGNLGHNMMFRSTTIQVNLDYSSESDMVKKFRVSMALQPISTAIFSNSPFIDGGLNGFKSYRSEIWTDTDPDRTGFLPFVLESSMGYEQYIDYALKVPMYFVYRDGEYIDVAGKSFNTFLEGNLNEVRGKPTYLDWENHLTTIFPEVRLKSFLEMRGADGGTFQNVCSLSAFWVGLLYDEISLNIANDLIKDWDLETLYSLRFNAAKYGLDSKIDGIDILNLSRKVLEISREGLKRRNILNDNSNSEDIYLKPLDNFLKNGKSPSDELIEKFLNNWDKKVVNMYKEYTF